jgi:hypothetical protein
MPIATRAFSAGHFVFHLDDGDYPAYINSVEGGHAKGNLMQGAVGQDPRKVKHISTTEIEPMSISMGPARAFNVIKWINDSWHATGERSENFGRRSGSVIHADFNYKAKYEHEFRDALVTEVGFPALDASSKSPGWLTLKFQPEFAELKAGDGSTIRGNSATKSKLWSPSNFRLTLDGVKCTHINKIDAITVKQKVKAFYSGKRPFPEYEPTGIEFPNVTFYTSLAYADDIIRWHKDTIYSQKNPDQVETNGSIEFLSPDLGSTLFSIELKSVGILSMNMEKAEGNADQPKKVKFEIYVNDMKLVTSDKSGFEITS